MLAIAADDLLNPVDVRRDPRHDVLLTVVPAETVDANKSPRALLISACQRTSAISLQTQRPYSVFNSTNDSLTVTVKDHLYFPLMCLIISIMAVA